MVVDSHLRGWYICQLLQIEIKLQYTGASPSGKASAFGADIFFDDSEHNIESASGHVASGHVPHGVANPERG